MALARASVREVCFAHWPVDADALRPALPDALAPATRAGTAWTSVLAQRTRAGLRGVPIRHAYPQVALRTYVRPAGAAGDGPTDVGDDGAVGVYFLRVEAASRLAALGGRLVFGLPFAGAAIEHESDDGRLRVRSVSGGGPASFAAEVEPRGDPGLVDPATPVGWLTDRYRYYLPDGRAGVTEHEPWTLFEVDGAVTAARIFDRAGLPVPDAEPLLRYSPGVDFALRSRP